MGKPENESLEISLESIASVLDLKQTIQKAMKEKDADDFVPVDRQRLIFSGKMLRDDSQFLVQDLSMKLGEKHFVHLTPLPKGAKVSTRTPRELTTSSETLSLPLAAAASEARQLRQQLRQQQSQQRGARRVGAQQRRRRRSENPAASRTYHPYDFAATRPSTNQHLSHTLRQSSNAASAAASATMAESQSATDAAVEQARRATEEAILASHEAGSRIASSIEMLSPYCPVGIQPQPNAMSLLRLQQQQLQLQLQQSALEQLYLQQSAIATAALAHPLLQVTAPSDSFEQMSQVHLLQDMLSLPGTSSAAAPQDGLAGLFEQVARRDEEMASNLRRQLFSQDMAPPPAATASALYSLSDIFSPAALASTNGTASAAAVTPMTPLSLEEWLNASAAPTEATAPTSFTTQYQTPEERLQALAGAPTSPFAQAPSGGESAYLHNFSSFHPF